MEERNVVSQVFEANRRQHVLRVIRDLSQCVDCGDETEADFNRCTRCLDRDDRALGTVRTGYLDNQEER